MRRPPPAAPRRRHLPRRHNTPATVTPPSLSPLYLGVGLDLAEQKLVARRVRVGEIKLDLLDRGRRGGGVGQGRGGGHGGGRARESGAASGRALTLLAMRLLLLAAALGLAAGKSVVSPDGRTVTLTNAAGVSATLTRGGAALQRYSTPDRDGKLDDIVLGLEDAAAYEVGGERGGGGRASSVARIADAHALPLRLRPLAATRK